MLVSRLSSTNASPIPQAKPRRRPSSMFRGTFGLMGLVGVRATSTTRILLDLRPALTPASLSRCKKILVKLSVRLRIALKNRVLNRAFVKLVSLLLLLIECGYQQTLPLNCRQIRILVILVFRLNIVPAEPKKPNFILHTSQQILSQYAEDPPNVETSNESFHTYSVFFHVNLTPCY